MREALGGVATLAVIGWLAPSACLSGTQTPRENGVLTGLPGAPLCFEANRGQAPKEFPFVARGRECSVLISPAEAVLVLADPPAEPGITPLDPCAPARRGVLGSQALRLRLVGASPVSGASGLGRMSGRANYYIGGDPAKWSRDVPLFSRVQIDQVYPGVRLVYYADPAGRLEYDFQLQPGASPDQIRLGIQGADTVELNSAGDLVLRAGGREIRQIRPALYQMVQGRRKQIEGGYRLAGTEAGFWTGKYNPALPLVIDPSLSFSEYIGGTSIDRAWGVAVDGGGNVWIAGETLSRNLPTTNALRAGFQGSPGVFGDGFVAKFANGTNLDYLTYLGGTGNDAAFAVAADSSGDAFITGYTDSPNFPIINAFQPRLGGTNLNSERIYPVDAFVTKLNPDGTLAYSSFLGGKGRDIGLGIAVDGSNRAYVTGYTESGDFPKVNSLQGDYVKIVSHFRTNILGTNLLVATYSTTNYRGDRYHGQGDAFVARVSAAGDALEYSTLLGGTDHDSGQAVAVDSANCAYVAGITGSFNFPITTNGLSVYQNSDTFRTFALDGFISKLSSDGGSLVYSSYLGGNRGDAALGVAVDAAGNAYVTGYTYSTNFPVTQTNFTAWVSLTNVNSDVFVTKLDPSGSTNSGYSVVFGGRLNDQGLGIAADPAGNAYVAGVTFSRTNFADIPALAVLPPGFSATNSTRLSLGRTDAFVVQLDPAGNKLFAAYLGGSGNDQANAIAFDPGANAAYVVGTTTSTNFPGANNRFHFPRSHSDAFISRIQFP